MTDSGDVPTAIAKTDAGRELDVPSPGELNHRVIAVELAGGLYGLPMEFVQEVISVRPLTRVFHAPGALAGVISLRGEVLPVLDPALLLGASQPTARSAPSVRILVVREEQGKKRRAGLLVDALGGLRDLPADGPLPVPDTVNPSAAGILIGIIPDPPPVSIIGVPKLLGSPVLAPLAAYEERTLGA